MDDTQVMDTKTPFTATETFQQEDQVIVTHPVIGLDIHPCVQRLH